MLGQNCRQYLSQFQDGKFGGGLCSPSLQGQLGGFCEDLNWSFSMVAFFLLSFSSFALLVSDTTPSVSCLFPVCGSSAWRASEPWGGFFSYYRPLISLDILLYIGTIYDFFEYDNVSTTNLKESFFGFGLIYAIIQNHVNLETAWCLIIAQTVDIILHKMMKCAYVDLLHLVKEG